ncbi:MAG: sensor histidine kinase [Tranquillimonas sp.]
MRLASLRIETDDDIPRLRDVGQVLAERCGFPKFAATRIVTALLEMGRNVIQHGGGGKMTLFLRLRDQELYLAAEALDQGPGIGNLDRHLAGQPRRPAHGSGLGLGLRGVKRLADVLEVDSGPEGTRMMAMFRTAIPAAEQRQRADALVAEVQKLNAADPAALLVQQNRELAEALAERDLLMAELHHRIKNNLSTVTALMRLSRNSVTSDEARRVLRDLEMQVRAIATVHERLQHSAASDRVPLLPLLESVVAQFRLAFEASNRDVEVALHCDDVVLDGRAVTDIALAIGELMTNSLKHAFEGRDRGRIEVRANLTGDMLQIAVADDGVGLPPDVERPERSSALGWVMIRNAVQKYGGFIRTSTHDGLSVEMSIMAEPLGARPA